MKVNISLGRNKKPKLKKCPNCGWPAYIALTGNGFQVRCTDCGTITQEYDSELGALKAWNHRKFYRRKEDQVMKAIKDEALGLKPCPFCGESAILVEYEEAPRRFKVKCGCDSHCGETTLCRSREAAIAIWNSRVNKEPHEIVETKPLQINDCPICGCPGYISVSQDEELITYQGKCSNCDAYTMKYDTDRKAAFAWNSRIYDSKAKIHYRNPDKEDEQGD